MADHVLIHEPLGKKDIKVLCLKKRYQKWSTLIIRLIICRMVYKLNQLHPDTIHTFPVSGHRQ